MQNRTANDRDGRGESGWWPKYNKKPKNALKRQQNVCKTGPPTIETVAVKAAGSRKYNKEQENALKSMQNRTANNQDGHGESVWSRKKNRNKENAGNK